MRVAARYLEVWLAQIRYSVTRDMMFKTNFLLWVGVEVVWFALQLVFIGVVYGHADEVAGWTQYEMVLLAGTNQLVQQIFGAFFMTNCFSIPELIRTGKMDFFLCQPLAPQFLLSTRLFELGGAVNAALAVCVCGYASAHLGLWPGPLDLLLFAAFVAAGVAVHYSLMLMLCTLSFWIVRSHGVMTAYFNLFNISRIPRQAFRGVARAVFTYAIPMLLVANVPAELLLRRPDAVLGATLVALAVAGLLLSRAFFNVGLGRYSSASS